MMTSSWPMALAVGSTMIGLALEARRLLGGGGTWGWATLHWRRPLIRQAPSPGRLLMQS